MWICLLAGWIVESCFPSPYFLLWEMGTAVTTLCFQGCSWGHLWAGSAGRGVCRAPPHMPRGFTGLSQWLGLTTVWGYDRGVGTKVWGRAVYCSGIPGSPEAAMHGWGKALGALGDQRECGLAGRSKARWRIREGRSILCPHSSDPAEDWPGNRGSPVLPHIWVSACAEHLEGTLTTTNTHGTAASRLGKVSVN